MATGRRAVCPTCERASSRASHRKSRDRNLAGMKAWQQADPNRCLAHRAIKYEIDAGRMKRRPCIACGKPDGQAHHAWGHEPENKLKVIFLCRGHHRRADNDPSYNSELVRLHEFVESI